MPHTLGIYRPAFLLSAFIVAEHNDSDDSRSVSQRQKEIKGRNIFIKICACSERNKKRKEGE
jgi:hypothetical protein